MKEQVITPRAGRSGGAGKGRAGEMMQRPLPRERGASSSRTKSRGARRARAYLPLAGKITLAVLVGVLIFAGYRAAASASFFQARNVDVSGTSRANADDIRAVVRRGVAQTGVWRADLGAISHELKNVAWVKEAVVSRVLPDGLRVRVTEREPRAIVRTSAGKFLWVDDEGVNLGPASPTDQISMRGWDEGATDAARAVNRERVQKFLEMTRDWETRGLSRRVSEVNLNDPNDARVQLMGDDAQIEIQLGKADFDNRLKVALEKLDTERRRASAKERSRQERKGQEGETFARSEDGEPPTQGRVKTGDRGWGSGVGEKKVFYQPLTPNPQRKLWQSARHTQLVSTSAQV